MSCLRVILAIIFPPLAVLDRGCGSVLIVALLTASVVCFTGTIGFVGLVCPHIVRMFIGSNSKYLLPASFVFGALFLVVIDSIAKVTGVNGLPVGVISALIGGPIFVYLLVKRRNSNWE